MRVATRLRRKTSGFDHHQQLDFVSDEHACRVKAHQRQDGIGFANACGMQPDELAIATRRGCYAKALIAPGMLFFALTFAIAKH